MKAVSLAGKPAQAAMLVNVPKLITAYYTEIPDPLVPGQLVAFGTSGHRGCAHEKSFNEWHVIAITEAICRYRKQHDIDGPLFLGMDTHALSEPAPPARSTHRHDYLNAYVSDLGNVIAMDAIRDANIRLSVDPLGGAGAV